MIPLTRRQFIGASAVGAAALMAGPSAFGASRKKPPIGVQLYSVRNDFAKDVPGVLAGIKKIGYEGVEFAGYANYGNNASGLRKLLDDNGLKACGSHIQGGLPTLQGDGFAGEQQRVPAGPLALPGPGAPLVPQDVLGVVEPGAREPLGAGQCSLKHGVNCINPARNSFVRRQRICFIVEAFLLYGSSD